MIGSPDLVPVMARAHHWHHHAGITTRAHGIAGIAIDARPPHDARDPPHDLASHRIGFTAMLTRKHKQGLARPGGHYGTKRLPVEIHRCLASWIIYGELHRGRAAKAMTEHTHMVQIDASRKPTGRIVFIQLL